MILNGPGRLYVRGPDASQEWRHIGETLSELPPSVTILQAPEQAEDELRRVETVPVTGGRL